MKILGIDYGFKYLGLAIADEQPKIAHPYKILENKGQDFVLAELKRLIEQEKISQIVVGRPIGLAGQLTEQTQITDQFIQFLKSNLPIPIDGFDERFTSKMADDDHAAAAAIILQDYLEKSKIKN
jgi:putative Holliday junction resolvase